jgi:GT2 family glycosyltransferase
VPDRLRVTVIVPTIGRPQLLAGLLHSLAAGDRQPAEVLVCDQSGERETRALCYGFAPLVVRWVDGGPPGIARAMNVGLRAAHHDLVLVTNDDITVAVDWVRRAHALLAADPAVLVTGRVLPGGDDAKRVPSTMLQTAARDFTRPQPWGLFPGNAGGNRTRILAIGGFDERAAFGVAAEDNDLAWRWLRAGNTIRYRPELVVWHHDWRTDAEIAARFREYGRGQGALYAKHVRAGDWRIAGWLVRDTLRGLRGHAARVVKHRAPHTDWRQGLFPGVLTGFVAGLRRG